MVFGNLRIGLRLGSGFGLVLIFTAVLLAVGISRMAIINDEVRALVSEDYQNLNQANLLYDTIRENAIEIRNLVLLKSEFEMAASAELIENRRTIYTSVRDKLAAKIKSEKGRELLAKIDDAAKASRPAEQEVIELGESNSTAKAVQILLDEVNPAQKRWLAAVQELVAYQRELSDDRAGKAHATYAAARSIMLILGAMIIAFGVIVSFYITLSVVRPIKQAVKVAARIASGDLTSRIEVGSKDETGQLIESMRTMNEKLKTMVDDINNAASLVGTGAQQISAGNLNLSQRTEEQASSLEETAASMEELTSTVKQNADNANQANQLASAARTKAESGGAVVGNAVRAMNSIDVASRKIADIVGVIDEIAFQTNLLALNAAVEAARAGEQGRGFAVVAAEVRNLAQRSAASAKEIKGLIQDSVVKVDDGARLVDESGVVLSDIVAAVKQVSDIVADIAAASFEQSTGIEHINKAITQMDEMTQQNAALVEEAAAASRSMEDQAQHLNDLMLVFKLRDVPGAAAATTGMADRVEVKPDADTAPTPGSNESGASQEQPEPTDRDQSATPPPGLRRAPKMVLAAGGRKAAGGEDDWREF